MQDNSNTNISIIIPMYNVEKYLNKCVASVYEQNFKPGTFEIIMVNDESPDNSLEVANKLALKHDAIKIISQKNKGLGGARNTGIENAIGRFLVFLDADDWLIPNTVNDIIEIATKNNLDVLEFGAHRVSEDHAIISSSSKSSHGKIYNGVDYYNKIKYAGSACNKLYSNQFLKVNNLRFLEKIYGEDFEFNTRIFYCAKKVMAVKNICAAFLNSSNSITRNKDRSMKDKYLNDFITILSSIKSFQTKNQQLPPIKSSDLFFKERFAMVNINAFYLMFKNNYSYRDMRKYRTKLIDKGLFQVSYSVSNKKKDLFRKVLLKNFYLLKVVLPIKNITK
ncbi:glycosyltransferase [Tamlana agarivorans]|uniref:Glycosyltransferase n=1 Tax=Pseudotamlana agarivorans TaxID=481183 RepID=A0ACC5UA30_9FLAO|nr:glycosyltransferase [Tamlana agarivorans]MBU2951161.1 glycosyltransferase [Tamlana agarivorans]